MIRKEDALFFDSLRADHTPEAVRKRLSTAPKRTYLRDLVFGAVDGTVTTFAIVAGVAGAGLSPGIVIILGMANLIGDGFSMAVGNFLATRADKELIEKARQSEELHIQKIPQGEREEIRQIFALKGFEGKDLKKAVELITSNRKEWINMMLREELSLSLNPVSPVRAAIATFTAFVLAGLLPVLPFLIQWLFPKTPGNPFILSLILTGAAFFLIGALKALITEQKWYRSGLETFAMGGSAAFLAFLVGRLLGGFGSQ